MKIRLFLAIVFCHIFFAIACGESEQYYPMCDCKPDEVCIDEVCSPTTSDIVPAPKDEL